MTRATNTVRQVGIDGEVGLLTQTRLPLLALAEGALR